MTLKNCVTQCSAFYLVIDFLDNFTMSQLCCVQLYQMVLSITAAFHLHVFTYLNALLASLSRYNFAWIKDVIDRGKKCVMVGMTTRGLSNVGTEKATCVIY